MSSDLMNVDRLRVAAPCPVSWEQMIGGNRVRSCEQCQLNVYNISALTRSEVQTLIASAEGRLCIKLYRRADGTVLTKDCPVGIRALRMRVSKRAAAIFAAVAGLSSLVFGQAPSGKNQKADGPGHVQISRTSSKPDSAGEVLSGIILDPAGAVIPGATIKAKNLKTKKVETATTNDRGSFQFKSLAAGTYSIKIEFPGFKTLRIKNLSVEKSQLTNLELSLEPKDTYMTVGVIDDSSLIAVPPGTTIINEKMIRSDRIVRSLPIQH